MADYEEERDGILLPERFIPTPTTISPQAQAFLRNPAFKSEGTMPALDDIEGWRRHAEQANQMLVLAMKGRAEEFPAEVVTHQLSAAAVYEIAPKSLQYGDAAILYIHGGGFFMGGGEAAILAAQQVAGLAGIRTFSVDYRMPPDHPFPAALDDCVEAYRWLLERYPAERIVLYGGSAGANLVPACLLRARAEGLPLAAACALHSPASDLTEAGDTFRTNTDLDVVLKRPLPELMTLYARDHDRTDPLLSPVFGDYSGGFPPTILTSGTRDLLLSSTVMLHRAMRRGGVRAELHVWEAMPHGLAHDAPEAQELLAEHIRFLHEALGLA